MAGRLTNPTWAAIDRDGRPSVGATLSVYDNTNALCPIFADTALTVRINNPLIADERGYFQDFYLATGVYTATIADRNSVTIASYPNLQVA